MTKKNPTRRALLKAGPAAALAPVAYAPRSPSLAAQPARQSIYEALGLNLECIAGEKTPTK